MVSLHHGGGVEWSFSQHAGNMVIVCDGTDEAAARIRRVLHNDRRRASCAMRAGYDLAVECAVEQVWVPMVAATQGKADMNTMTLTPGQLSLSQRCTMSGVIGTASAGRGAIDGINASVACVNDIVAEGRTAYGIQHRFRPAGAKTRIADEDLQNLQRSLVLSHAAGVRATSRTGPTCDGASDYVLINSLARGFSGIRLSGEASLVNTGVYPAIPAKRLGWRVGRLSAAGASVADAAWRRESALAG